MLIKKNVNKTVWQNQFLAAKVLRTLHIYLHLPPAHRCSLIELGNTAVLLFSGGKRIQPDYPRRWTVLFHAIHGGRCWFFRTMLTFLNIIWLCFDMQTAAFVLSHVPTLSPLPSFLASCLISTWIKHKMLMLWYIFSKSPTLLTIVLQTRVPSFLSIDTDGRVMRFDSFSKMMSAG